ncbi:MAG: hypothetical protein QM778_26190 [Myxococcales bacterium]
MTRRNHTRWLLPAVLCAPLWMGAEECTKANVGSQKVCEYDGKVWAPGDQFPSTDHCNTCSCTSDGHVACTEKACAPSGADACSYNGSVYAAGDSFPSEDGCNTCTCGDNGDVACTEKACAPGGGSNGSDGGVASGCEFQGKYYAADTTFTLGCAGCGCADEGQIYCDAVACVGGCSFGDRTFHAGASVTCPDGCNTCTCGPNGPNDTEGDWQSTLIGCPALPKLEKCSGPDPADVTTVIPLYLEGDALALQFSYGGGCKTHSFRLCTDGALSKSLPGQLKLWLVDDGEPDPCEALATQTKVFSVSSLKSILGAQATGSIVLRLGNTSVPYEF